MFVLDTTVVSELRKAKAGKANKGVEDWARNVPAVLMFLSAVTLYELEHGVLLAERRDPPKGETLRKWLDSHVMTAFAERILPIDGPIARHAAALHVPDPAPLRDSLIAASALAHGMTVVTRNVSDFERFSELEVLDPWT
jgi:predicted nucleic acid-binding protein